MTWPWDTIEKEHVCAAETFPSSILLLIAILMTLRSWILLPHMKILRFIHYRRLYPTARATIPCVPLGSTDRKRFLTRINWPIKAILSLLRVDWITVPVGKIVTKTLQPWRRICISNWGRQNRFSLPSRLDWHWCTHCRWLSPSPPYPYS